MRCCITPSVNEQRSLPLEKICFAVCTQTVQFVITKLNKNSYTNLGCLSNGKLCSLCFLQCRNTYTYYSSVKHYETLLICIDRRRLCIASYSHQPLDILRRDLEFVIGSMKRLCSYHIYRNQTQLVGL